MKTRIFKDTKEDIEEAGRIIASGGLVAFPTETVYGLGANALDEEAVSKIYKAKGRPSDNPMIVHISDIDDLQGIARLSDDALSKEAIENIRKVAVAFWPGPLTMVLPKSDRVPEVTTGGLDTVAVRFPSNHTAQLLIEKSGHPIAAPSANLSGKPSPTTAAHTLDDMEGRIDGLIWGEDCEVGIESTVVDMRKPTPVILRPGKITKEDLERALGIKVDLHSTLEEKALSLEDREPCIAASKDDDSKSKNEEKEDLVPISPGMKYKHYAPDAAMTVFLGPKEKALKAAEKEAHRLKTIGHKVQILVFDNPEIAAHDLFRKLREADKSGCDDILAVGVQEQGEEGGIAFSVMNRMLKSAGHNIRKV